LNSFCPRSKGKYFFFEKKKQKTFAFLGVRGGVQLGVVSHGGEKNMMTRNWRRFAALVATSTVLGIGHAAARTYHYHYVSNKYDVVNGAQCLTTSMHLQLTLTLAGPLPANANDLVVTPKYWRASNGLHEFSSIGKNAGIETIQFWTDANGNIVNWVVALYRNLNTGYLEEIVTNKPPNSAGADFGYQDCSKGDESDAIASTIGTWKQPKHLP
jgi:hypothetical protein